MIGSVVDKQIDQFRPSSPLLAPVGGNLTFNLTLNSTGAPSTSAEYDAVLESFRVGIAASVTLVAGLMQVRLLTAINFS